MALKAEIAKIPDVIQKTHERQRRLKIAAIANNHLFKANVDMESVPDPTDPRRYIVPANFAYHVDEVRSTDQRRAAARLGKDGQPPRVKTPGSWRPEKGPGKDPEKQIRHQVADTMRSDAHEVASLFAHVGIEPTETFQIINKKGKPFRGWRIDAREVFDPEHFDPSRKPDQQAQDMYKMVISEDGELFEWALSADHAVKPPKNHVTSAGETTNKIWRRGDKKHEHMRYRLPHVNLVNGFHSSDQLSQYAFPSDPNMAPLGSDIAREAHATSAVDGWRDRLAIFVERTLAANDVGNVVSAPSGSPEAPRDYLPVVDDWAEGEIVDNIALPGRRHTVVPSRDVYVVMPQDVLPPGQVPELGDGSYRLGPAGPQALPPAGPQALPPAGR